MKRLLSILLVLAMMVVCCTASAEGKTKLSIILITGYEFFADEINAYTEAHPDVEVDLQIMPTSDYKTLIKTRLASNDAPDILPVFCEADYYGFYENGYLHDMSDMPETLGRLKGGAVDSFVMEDGGILGIPYTEEFLLGYYNKEMFAEHGVEIPKTWEDLLVACETFKAAGITPIAFGHKDAWVALMITYGLNATSVQFADPDFYKGTMDGASKFAESEGWLDTLTRYRGLIDAGYANEGSLSTTAEQMYELFVNKEAAMFFGGTWCDASVAELNPDFTVGGFEIPAPGGCLGAAASITGGYGISAKSENIDAAKDLLAYLLSAEALNTYGTQVASTFMDVTTGLRPALQEALDMMAGQPCYQYDDTYFVAGLQMVMCSAIQELIAGTMTPMEVLETMDAATEKALR